MVSSNMHLELPSVNNETLLSDAFVKDQEYFEFCVTVFEPRPITTAS